MGRGRERRAIEQNARAQERVADDQRDYFEFMREDANRRAAQDQSIRDQVLPHATRMIEDPDWVLGPSVAFPDIQRPDFTDQARRQYFDDVAGIADDRRSALAHGDDFMRGAGLARSGIRGATAGSILAQASGETAAARRTFQDRETDERRMSYEDQRDLALQRYGAERTEGAQRADIRMGGLNALSGQQAGLNPLGAHALASGNLAQSGMSQHTAGQSRVAAGQLPGVWDRVAQIGGTAAGIASNYWGRPRPTPRG